jgi:hypothetical protein
MKNLTESSKPVESKDKLTFKFNKGEILNIEAMKCICGGDAEDDGGANIIIIPKP